MDEFILRSARHIAAEACGRVLKKGDVAVDATMGNGHDTLLLCRLVGDTGKVHAFDVQRQALENTLALLRQHGMENRAVLHLMGHERMGEMVPPPVKLVMFNLGWLPGSDKKVRTAWPTTRQALDTALSLLCPNGLCVVCVYPGHPEGEEERQQLLAYLQALPPQQYNVLRHQFVNAGEQAPECVLIQRQ
jgi:hypothetical protein